MLHHYTQKLAYLHRRGEFSLSPALIRGGLVLLTVLIVTGLDISSSQAAGARQAVDAAPGEIVLTRDVSARHAIRQAPDGKALLMDVGPEEQVEEMTEGDYMTINSRHTAGTVNHFTSNLTGVAQSDNNSNSGFAGPGRTVMGAPTGAVGSVTRAAGDQVMGALQGAGLLGK